MIHKSTKKQYNYSKILDWYYFFLLSQSVTWQISGVSVQTDLFLYDPWQVQILKKWTNKLRIARYFYDSWINKEAMQLVKNYRLTLLFLLIQSVTRQIYRVSVQTDLLLYDPWQILKNRTRNLRIAQ